MPIKQCFEFLCFASQLYSHSRDNMRRTALLVNSNQCSTPWWTKETMTGDIKCFLMASPSMPFPVSMGNILSERVGGYYNKFDVSCLHCSSLVQTRLWLSLDQHAFSNNIMLKSDNNTRTMSAVCR